MHVLEFGIDEPRSERYSECAFIAEMVMDSLDAIGELLVGILEG